MARRCNWLRAACYILLYVCAVAQDATTATTDAAAPSGTASQYLIPTLFTAAILNSTNFFRSEHNASALHWNASLADYATSYLTRDNCAFAHSGGPYGENLAFGYANVTAAVDAWGDERAAYDWSAPGFSDDTGHFTQLVWKATSSVGCGVRNCSSVGLGWLLACEYTPRGNIEGAFAANVQAQVNGSGSGGWCPQGAACDGAGVLRVPGWTAGLSLLAWWATAGTLTI